MKECCAKWKCTERSMQRYIAKAKDDLTDALFNKEKYLNFVREEALNEDFEQNLKSTLEIEMMLCSLAFNENTPVPNRISAAQTLLRMRGKEKITVAKTENPESEKSSTKPIPLKGFNEEEQKIVDSI